MVIMASGIARGRVRTTTTAELPNMAAILQNNRLTETCSLGLPCTSLILDIHVMINWKQGIRWPVSRDHIAGSSSQLLEVMCFFWSWLLTKCWLLIGSRAHIRLTYWKQGRIVRKLVNANPGLKVNRIITFSSIRMFFAVLLCVYGDY